MPNLRESKLYETFTTKNLDHILTECYKHINSGKDVNIQDSDTGETYLHCLCDRIERFMDPNGVSIIYIMACKGLDLDIQDNTGETFLHKIVRIPGAYRGLVAAIRCGADMMVHDNCGKTAEDIILTEKPDGWEEMLHWWNKFKPGLYRATLEDNPDRQLVEKLLKYWCRVNMVKQGKNYSVKTELRQQAKHIDLVYLLEKHENSIEFALAALSGKVQILKSWKERVEECPKAMKTVDTNRCDYSYQSSLSSEEVPLPLLAAVWEMNRLDMSELVMEYGADSTLLYSHSPATEPVKPLFFQLVCGENKPNDDIVYRTLHKSDLSARNYDGQTLLYEAITHKASPQLVQFLFKRGINIAARDKYGRTARDYASLLNRHKYVKLIDQYVAELVKNCDIPGIESLILHGYDHIMDVTDEKEELGMMNLAKLTGSEILIQVLEKRCKSKEHIDKMLKLAHKGRLAELRPLLGRKYLLAVDICGRNVCHIAVTNKRREFIKCFCDHYGTLLNLKDNLGRTPFHYAQLLYEGDELLDYMLEKGADKTIKDVFGRSPLDYKCSECGQKTFFTLQKEVKNYHMDVYAAQTNFKDSLTQAIKEGKLDTVTSLITGMKSQSKDVHYLNRYNILLFICLDYNQEDIALYLINQGMDVHIFKQYDKCDSNDPMCAMLECGHSPKSFQEIAKQMKCQKVLDYLDKINKEKEKENKEMEAPGCITFTQFGLV